MSKDEEKIESLSDKITELAIDANSNKINITNINEKVQALELKFDCLAERLATNKDEIIAGVKAEFVKHVEFEPVKTLVYGLVGGVLVTVLGAVLALIIVPNINNNRSYDKLDTPALASGYDEK